MWLRVAVARLLMSQAPGQMSLFCCGFPFHTILFSIPLLVSFYPRKLLCSLFIYHVRAGDGECNCSSKHDISLSNPCVPFHMCVCVCVFFLCVVVFASKATRFSSPLDLWEGYGWKRGAMLC